MTYPKLEPGGRRCAGKDGIGVKRHMRGGAPVQRETSYELPPRRSTRGSGATDAISYHAANRLLAPYVELEQTVECRFTSARTR